MENTNSAPSGQNCTYIPPGDHRRELYRLGTYAGFPKSVPVKPTDMAAAGFYYTGYKDRVRCFSCGITAENWALGDDGMDDQWHKSNCKMMAGHEIFNEPIQEPNFRSLFKLHRADPRSDFTNSPAIVDPQHEMNMRNEAERREVFENWPSDPTPYPVNSSPKAGCFCSGNSDRAQCSDVLRNWASSDNVSQLHRTHCRHCKICRGEPSGNNPMPAAQRSEMDRQHRAKMERLTANQGEPADPSPEEQRDLAERFPCREPVNPHMVSLATRISTFNNLWPRQRIRAPMEQIAKAGFFYLGESDKTKRFYCNGGLQNWDINDEPWTEHAKCFPSRAQTTSRNHVPWQALSNHRRRPVSQGKFNGKRFIDEKRGTTESDALPIVERDMPEAEPERDSLHVYLPDERKEKYRLASFSRYPGNFVTSMRLAARHGLYFTGRGDVARCYSCCTSWNISQGAYTTNLHQSNCQMRNPQFAINNVPMDGFGQFQEALQRSQAITQLSASPGETSEQEVDPSPPKRQRGNESRQFSR